MKKDVTVRSSAAEYLTFITASGESQVEAIYFDENVWLTQKMMGVLYDVEANTITYHLQKAFRSLELDENSVTRKFRVTASDGKSYDTKHYNLKAIISVGNKVDSPKAVQFRKWANNVIEEYTIKGFAMDDERLKNGGTVLTKKYFEELIDEMKAKKGVSQDVDLTAEDLKELASQFKAEYKEKIGEDFPDDPKEQLMGAIKAVFRSWDNPRANVYRMMNNIPYLIID